MYTLKNGFSNVLKQPGSKTGHGKPAIVHYDDTARNGRAK
jgi:hypothetical protein